MKHYESINDSMGKDVPKKLIYYVGTAVILLRLNPYFYLQKKCKDRYKVCGNFVVGAVLKLILLGIVKVNIII